MNDAKYMYTIEYTYYSAGELKGPFIWGYIERNAKNARMDAADLQRKHGWASAKAKKVTAGEKIST